MYGCQVVKKSDLDFETLKLIKKVLTFKNSKFGNGFYNPNKVEPEYLRFYSEYPDEILLPRNTLEQLRLKIPNVVKVGNDFSSTLKFNKTLRDYQVEFFKQIPPNEYDMIWAVPAGHGKTIMTLYHLSRIKQRAIIFVNTDFLRKQWVSKVKSFCGEDAVIIDKEFLDAKKRITENVYVITLQFYILNEEEIHRRLNWDFGIEVYDECHRLGAQTYYPVLENSIVPRRLSLTATYRRQDNLHMLLQYSFGNCYKMERILPPPLVYGVMTNITLRLILNKEKLRNIDALYKTLVEQGVYYAETSSYISFNTHNLDLEDIDGRDKRYILRTHESRSMSSLESMQVELNKRRHIAESILDECLHAGRKVLFLSKRKSHLKNLHEKYKSLFNSLLIVSETNKKLDFENLKGVDVVFGINNLAQEALDIDFLDTLIIYHGMRDTEQPIGRISRVVPGKKTPVAFYLYDNHPSSIGLFTSARRNYVPINGTFKGSIKWNKISETLAGIK